MARNASGRTRAALLGAVCAVASASLAASAPAPRDAAVKLYLDGRRVDAKSPSADLRNGTLFVNLVRAVAVYDGLLTFGAGGSSRATFAGRTIDFRRGRATALLDGRAIPLPAAPFVRDGDTFVPLATIARLTGARLRYDGRRGRADLTTGLGDVFPPASASDSDNGDDVAPSLAQALALVPSLVATPSGALEARLDVTNRTARPFVVAFTGPGPVSFSLERNGATVWTAQAIAGAAAFATPLQIEPFGTRHFAARWDGAAAAGAARYVLRATLATAAPIVTTPVSLDYVPLRAQ